MNLFGESETDATFNLLFNLFVYTFFCYWDIIFQREFAYRWFACKLAHLFKMLKFWNKCCDEDDHVFSILNNKYNY